MNIRKALKMAATAGDERMPGRVAAVVAIGGGLLIAACGSGGSTSEKRSPLDLVTAAPASTTAAPASTTAAPASTTTAPASSRLTTTAPAASATSTAARPSTTLRATTATPTTTARTAGTSGATAATQTCEFGASITSINLGDAQVPIYSNTVTFHCTTVAGDGTKTVVAKNPRGVKIDIKKESSVAETPDRRALVDDLRNTVKSLGYREVGRGTNWYSYIFQR